jgi:membrane-bound ClpP family serine protease
LALGVSLFGAVIAYIIGRTLFTQQTAGVDEMVGWIGQCEATIGPENRESKTSSKGKVFVRGEYWNCVSEDLIEVGDSIEVVSVQGLTLCVRKATSGG